MKAVEQANESDRNWNPAVSSAGAPRILVVEDEVLLTLSLEDDLRDAGLFMLGPYTTLELALQASRSESFDLALLDVNLRGEAVFPLADELIARNIPIVFLTGYGVPATNQLRDVVAFMMLVLVLIFRPYGLLGKKH